VAWVSAWWQSVEKAMNPRLKAQPLMKCSRSSRVCLGMSFVNSANAYESSSKKTCVISLKASEPTSSCSSITRVHSIISSSRGIQVIVAQVSKEMFAVLIYLLFVVLSLFTVGFILQLWRGDLWHYQVHHLRWRRHKRIRS